MILLRSVARVQSGTGRRKRRDRYIVLGGLTFQTMGADDQKEIGADIYCPACRYSLYRAPGDNCPECGRSIVSLRNDQDPIPWMERKRRGRFRAYWQTVWMVTFRHRRFCENFAHEVRLSDARSFQCITVLCIYLLALLGTVVVYLMVPPTWEVVNAFDLMMTGSTPRPGQALIDRAYAEVWPVAVIHVCFVSFLFAATGVPSYFFRPRSVAPQQQNNAVAMSYYACAPFAWVLPVLLGLCAAICFLLFDKWLARAWGIDQWFGPVPVVALAVVVALWWWSLVQLARRTMPQLGRRAVAVAFGVPASWLALGVLFLGLLPLIVLYVLVVIASFGD